MEQDPGEMCVCGDVCGRAVVDKDFVLFTLIEIGKHWRILIEGMIVSRPLFKKAIVVSVLSIDHRPIGSSCSDPWKSCWCLRSVWQQWRW